MAIATLGAGRTEEAEPLLRKVVELDPCSQGPRLKLSRILTARGAYAEERELLEAGVAACPHMRDFRNDLAYLLAACRDDSVRDGPEALRLANGKDHGKRLQTGTDR